MITACLIMRIAQAASAANHPQKRPQRQANRQRKIVKPRPGLPDMSRALLGPHATDDEDESEMDQFGPTDYSSDSANSASREAQIDLRRRLDRLKYNNHHHQRLLHPRLLGFLTGIY